MGKGNRKRPPAAKADSRPLVRTSAPALSSDIHISARSESAKSEASIVSGSTTQQTGWNYIKGFKEGFGTQNGDKVTDNNFLWEEREVYKADGSILGDIDLAFQMTTDCKLSQLLPVGATFDDIDLRNGQTVLVELTSMDGSIAVQRPTLANGLLGPSKVQKEKVFYQELFKEYTSEMRDWGVEPDNCIVLFVYNGIDFHDVRKWFRSKYFTGRAVHIPHNIMVSWQSDFLLNKAESALEAEHALRLAAEERAERAEEEVAALRKRLEDSTTGPALSAYTEE